MVAGIKMMMLQTSSTLMPPSLHTPTNRPHLGPDVVEDGQQDAVEDPLPERVREHAPVALERVEEHLKSTVADLGPEGENKSVGSCVDTTKAWTTGKGKSRVQQWAKHGKREAGASLH